MEEIGKDLLRYGRLVISKELFDSDGTPIRVRIFYHSDQYWYTEMKNGKFIDIYGLKNKERIRRNEEDCQYGPDAYVSLNGVDVTGSIQ